MINAPPPVMATYGGRQQPSIGDWFAHHPQFAGGNGPPGLGGGGLQGSGMDGSRMFGFLGALMNGQHPPRFDAWRDRRMAQGLPFTGPQFQPTQNTNVAFNAQPAIGSGYGGGNMVRSY